MKNSLPYSTPTLFHTCRLSPAHPALFLMGTKPWGIVQSRWTYLNKDYSLVPAPSSHAIDVHFLVEQPGKICSRGLSKLQRQRGCASKKSHCRGRWLAVGHTRRRSGPKLPHPDAWIPDSLLENLVCPCEIPPTVPSSNCNKDAGHVEPPPAAIKNPSRTSQGSENWGSSSACKP